MKHLVDEEHFLPFPTPVVTMKKVCRPGLGGGGDDGCFYLEVVVSGINVEKM
jgi:hypothetical protein